MLLKNGFTEVSVTVATQNNCDTTTPGLGTFMSSKKSPKLNKAKLAAKKNTNTDGST